MELAHWRDEKHHFTEYEVFSGLRLTLCNFCDVDFSSYNPEFFGLPPKSKLGLSKMNVSRAVSDASPGIDKFCSHCGYRLAFLRFVQRARELHAS
ncbi:hypothetical protein DSM104443_02278 [Usitatibacter rugosus]|uniref:Uncharacterized protein n=1 Tax=Usitatibacter rugosus TaxID=2732067 RepID=A0A6M4GW21_9PROT|nr:hypothetical protein [Usitatibacter rugosus]QJR11205.1 hypothetical protein DSM104443_02278 [Usitatibacter rugosus]